MQGSCAFQIATHFEQEAGEVIMLKSVANLATALQQSTITSITIHLGSISGKFLRNRVGHQYHEYGVLDPGLNVTAI